jgi:hypothetical protein
MPLTDGAVLVPGVGHVLTATVGAADFTYTNLTAYVSAGTIPSGYDELGHTDLDDVLVFDQDGGDTTTKGSWQNPSLVTVITSATVDFFTIKAEQVLDNNILTLYYGGGDATVTNTFAWPDAPAAQNKAVVLILLYGSTPLAFYFPKCSVLRGDAPDIASDDFMKLPLKFTVLQQSGKKRAYMLNDSLGA